MSNLTKLIKKMDSFQGVGVSNPEFRVWRGQVERTLKKEFGEESDEYKQFSNISFYPSIVSTATPESNIIAHFNNSLKTAKLQLESYLDEASDEPVLISKFPKELKLHPKIISASEKLFRDKHYSQAIFEAAKTLEKEIQTKSNIRDRIGVDLVNHAFNKDHPIIKIVEGNELEQKDEREGFRFLYMGAFLGIKNPKSHSMPHLKDPAKAIEYISFFSLLMKRLDESS